MSEKADGGSGQAENSGYREFLSAELNSHQKFGAFKQNTLFTKTVADADLDPLNKWVYPLALPIHVHEYVHYLHNISTISGLLFFLNELYFIFEFVKGTNGLGEYDPARVDCSVFPHLVDTNNILNGRLIFSDLPEGARVKAWSFSDPVVSNKTICLQGHDIEGCLLTSVSASAEIDDGIRCTVEFNVGLTLITEGVAYEIDREIRRGLDKWINLDKDVPAYPYLIYRHFVDFLLSRESTVEERIILGACALSSPSPGAELLKGCAALAAGGLKGITFLDYRSKIVNGYLSFCDGFKANIAPQLLISFQDSPLIARGLKDYLSIIYSAVEYRSGDFALELGLCQLKEVSEFRDYVARVAPQWISQEKRDSSRVISWHGKKQVVESIDEGAISALQSIFHYIQAHVLSDGALVATKFISGVQCPFVGACKAQEASGFPIECVTKPWDVKLLLSGEEVGSVCFYNTGVRSLFEAEAEAAYPPEIAIDG